MVDEATVWSWKNQLPFYKFITATLTRSVDAVDRVIPAGTRVRIWMVSRFGDVGITDNLTHTARGYIARVDFTGNASHRNPSKNFDESFSDVKVEDLVDQA